MPFVTTNGARIYWRVDGRADQPTLLMGNSLGTDMYVWEPIMPALTRLYRVVRMDWRGHGASDAPAGNYTIASLAQDVLAVADAAGTKEFDYIGLSIGGMIGMHLAADSPQRIRRLVISNSSAKTAEDVWAGRINTVKEQGIAGIVEASLGRYFTERYRARNTAHAASVRAHLESMSVTGYLGCCAAIRDMDLRPALKNIVCPTLIIAGKQDQSTPMSMAELLHAGIAGSQLAVFNAAHFTHSEFPSGFVRTVLGFLRQTGTFSGSLHGDEDSRYQRGLARRKHALGADYVNAKLASLNDFNTGFQDFITRYAWGEVWTQPAFDDRMRRMLVLAITASLSRHEEYLLHMRAAVQSGDVESADLIELMHQVAIYAGVPAANSAMNEANKVLQELDR